MNVTGDRKGRPYGRKGQRGMMVEGKGGSRTTPTGGVVERLNVTGDRKEPVSKVSAPLSAVKRCDAKRNHAQ